MRGGVLGERWYIIGDLCAREVRETHGPREEGASEEVTGPKPGDLLILPAPRGSDRYVTSIHGLSDATLLTLDRDGLMEALGSDVEAVSIGLDKLWEQELAAADAAQAQEAWRAAAPIAAFFSAKGGSGATTLAINTGAALADKYPRQVLLL